MANDVLNYWTIELLNNPTNKGELVKCKYISFKVKKLYKQFTTM